MNESARQAASYNMRLRRRGRQFADALTVWASALNVTGADRANGMLQSGVAMFVQDADGNAWVALTSGVTGDIPLSGNATMSDGNIVWQPWPGIIRAMPPTPA